MKGEKEGKQTLVFARNHKSSCVCIALELTTWVGIVSFPSPHNTGRILCVILGSVETQFPVLPKASELRSHCTVIWIQFFRLFLVFLSPPHVERQKGSRFPWTNSIASVGGVLFCYGNGIRGIISLSASHVLPSFNVCSAESKHTGRKRRQLFWEIKIISHVFWKSLFYCEQLRA